MNERVIDASMCLAWLLADEKEGPATHTLDALDPSDRLWVPALFWYEVANALVVARRRGRLREAEVAEAVEALSAFNFLVDPLLGADAVRRFTAVAEHGELSAYDAAYLELAGRKRAILWSLDDRLVRAARKIGVRTEIG